MNKILISVIIVLAVAVSVLFYLQFAKHNNPAKNFSTSSQQNGSSYDQPFRIAYFDMDSIESNFSLAKEMQSELTKKEEAINVEMNRLQNDFQKRYQHFQELGPTMNQAQLEVAQRELFELEQSIKGRKAQLDQDYQSFYLNKQQEIISLIKKFCEDFNKDKIFTLIIANEPGLIYYKDSTYNITSSLLKGLNELYQLQKKK